MEEIITTDSSADMINEYNDPKMSWKIFMTTLHKELLSDQCVTLNENGKKSSKYFLNFGKRNKSKLHLRKLLLPDGNETEDPQIIMSNIHEFYESLYRRRST